jgi:hypothetical protein
MSSDLPARLRFDLDRALRGNSCATVQPLPHEPLRNADLLRELLLREPLFLEIGANVHREIIAMLFPSVNRDARCTATRIAHIVRGMPKKPRKPLEEWQVADARRLLALWEEAKLADPDWPAQAAFASTYGIGETQGSVWQYLHGKIPLNLTVALKFAKGLGCEVSKFSPTLADQLPRGLRVREAQPDYGDLPTEIANEVIEIFKALSPAQRDAALIELRVAARANREVESRLKTKLRHPTDRQVEKALQLSPSRLAADTKPRRRDTQLPLFPRSRKP